MIPDTNRTPDNGDRTPAYLGLGSNLGDRTLYLQQAIERLSEDDRITVGDVSPVYESAAHVRKGQPPAPDFLNAVAKIQTDYSPHELLDRCLDIERDLGRDRNSEGDPGRWLPRTIDIDILLIDELTIADDHLTVPHPRLHQRRFVLQPLAEIAPDVFVPGPYNSTVNELLAACQDNTVLVPVKETFKIQPGSSRPRSGSSEAGPPTSNLSPPPNDVDR